MNFFTEIAVNGGTVTPTMKLLLLTIFTNSSDMTSSSKVAHRYLYKVAIKGSHCNFGFLLPAAVTQKLAPTSEATIRMP